MSENEDNGAEALPERRPKPLTQRHINRMAIIQFLYMSEINPPDVLADSVRSFFENQEKPREFYEYSEEVIHDIQDKLQDIDLQIQEYSQNWKLSRIAKTDLAILRLGMYELLFREDIPPVVVIDEAIELGREFSTDQSNTFINGILDRALRAKKQQES
jgi:N utilization substance protein B